MATNPDENAMKPRKIPLLVPWQLLDGSETHFLCLSLPFRSLDESLLHPNEVHNTKARVAVIRAKWSSNFSLKLEHILNIINLQMQYNEIGLIRLRLYSNIYITLRTCNSP